MKHVHIGLQSELISELELAALEENTTKTDIIRVALREYLVRRKQRRKEESMRRYAEEMAGESSEFTELSDDAVVSTLLAETEW